MKNLVLIIFTALLLVCSCTTTRFIEVPVEVVKKEYIRDTQTDSIYVRDSIDRWREGDTVFIYRDHFKYKYRDRVDTIVRIDSVPKIIMKEVEVNNIHWYHEALMWFGGLSLILLVGFVVYKIKI